MSEDDTIVALSSGKVPAGLAVLRISGPAAFAATQAHGGPLPEPRRAALRRFRDGEGATIDHGLVVLFPGPASATGEDVAEWHLHGGPAVVAAALVALCAWPDLRLAQAGEFTRRAFLNGRIDLTQAEGLAALLAAETEGQRREALRGADGALRRLYEGWAERLLQARALLEAGLDFADEGDVGDEVSQAVGAAAAALAREIAAHLDAPRRGEIRREGFRVALVGAPNSGKSSLLNALAGREAAIVTAVPGTTRDTIEVRLDLAGVAVILVDTAGIRRTADAVERIGIARARRAAREADLVLHLEDAAAGGDPAAPAWPGDADPDAGGGGEDGGEDGRDRDAGADLPPVVRLRTKADLDTAARPADTDAAPSVSSHTGEGLAALVALLAARAAAAAGDPADVLPISLRQREAAAGALQILRGEDLEALPPEILAETLRRAGDRLGALTGRTGVEDILDRVFRQFCIGK